MHNKELKSLLKHSSIYGIGTIAGQAAGFLLLPLYTRYLTPTDYGIATIIEITMALVGVTVGAGILNSMTRFYHDYDDDASKNCVISTMYWMIAGISAVSFIAIFNSSAFLADHLFSDPRYASFFNINAGALALGLLVDTALLYLMIKQKSLLYVTISLATLALQIGFNVWFIVFLGLGLEGIFYSTLITRAILLLVVSLPVLLKTGIRFSRQLAISMFSFSFPMVFSSLFRLAANESDKYFINYFFSPFETGIYAVANKIGTSVHTLITTPFLRSFNPKRFEIMNQPDARKFYISTLNYYMLIIVTAGFMLSLLSNEIIYVMTTENYSEAAHYIPMIVMSFIIFGMRYHFETGILIAKKTSYFSYINGFTAVLNILLNYLLIAQFKIWGALVALNISQLITTILFYRVSQRLYPLHYDFGFIIKLSALACCFYMAGTALEHGSVTVNLALKLLVAIFYLLSLRVCGLVGDETIHLIKKLWHKTTKFIMAARVSAN